MESLFRTIPQEKTSCKKLKRASKCHRKTKITNRRNWINQARKEKKKLVLIKRPRKKQKKRKS